MMNKTLPDARGFALSSSREVLFRFEIAGTAAEAGLAEAAETTVAMAADRPENRLKPSVGGLALAFRIMHDIGAADL